MSSPICTMFLSCLIHGDTALVFTHESKTVFCYALGESFRTIFPKWTKNYAKRYHRESFGLKQDMQILVGLGRHSRLDRALFP